MPVPPTQDSSASSPILIDYAELFERIVNGDTVVQRLEGEVELRQDSMFIYCDEATITNDSIVVAQGNVVVLQNDTISLFADSLYFTSTGQLARLFNNVVLVNGEQKLFTDSLDYDLANKIGRYKTRSKLTDGEAQLSSLRGSYSVNDKYAFFMDSVFVVRSDFNLISDSLGFATEQRIVYFEGPTVMATEDSRVYCEDGFYNLADSIGRFSQNAQVARGTQRAVAEDILYYGKDKRFELRTNARFVDGERKAKGDLITYSESTNLTTLSGDALFIEGEQRVAGEKIYYDGTTQVFNSAGRVKIKEDSYKLDADSLWFDEISGIAHVAGNVTWQDTLNQRSIQADFVDYKKEGEYVRAFGGRPMYTTVLEGDSLFLSADTLVTFRQATKTFLSLEDDTTEVVQLDSSLVNQDSVMRMPAQLQQEDSLDIAIEASMPRDSSQQVVDSLLPMVLLDSTRQDLRPLALGDTTGLVERVVDTSVSEAVAFPDSVRMLLAYPDVRIYKSNLQALCDSLAYNELDSSFTLFESPILWSDTSQFVADTVVVRLKNKNIDRVNLKRNAMIVNSPDELFFNQIKGRSVDVVFNVGEIDQMYVRGNAESVYYILDEEKAYVGLNHVKSARMRMKFGDGELSDIYFYDQPDGDLSPLAPVGEEPKLLEDFKWETDLRPESKTDLN